MLKTKRPILYFAIALAVLALLFGMWFQHNTSAEQTKSLANLETATVLPQPKTVPRFNLISQENTSFTLENLKGHWSLLFFGFTNCPYLCPTTLSTLNESFKLLEKDHLTPMPQMVFISVDPERDHPARIKEYLSSFNKQFVGATGSPQQLEALTKSFNILYTKIKATKSNEEYSIDHSGTILMLDPKGQLFAIFSTPHDATKIAHDVKSIIEANNAR